MVQIRKENIMNIEVYPKTKEGLLQYVYDNKKEYVKDLISSGYNGYREVDCLISIIENESVTWDNINKYI
jgi:hypothetical protein